MKVFLVHAHPEPNSFNASMTSFAKQILEGCGHEVIISDLYAMRFNPVSDRHNFLSIKDPDYLKLQVEELHASREHAFAPDIHAEMEKLLWCDCLILQFPLWWFSLPAILKGWVDRVFAMGRTYGGERFYFKPVHYGSLAERWRNVAGRQDI